MSTTAICDEHAAEVAAAGADGRVLPIAFERAVDLVHAFPQEEEPTADQDQISSRERPAQVNSGAVSLMTQAMDISSRIRVPIASRGRAGVRCRVVPRAAGRRGWR